MSRLFVTPRELNFISDITKEVIKDIAGQTFKYYPISETKTNAHAVYGESMEKVFDAPIDVDALIDSKFHVSTKINQFGIDQVYKIEAFVQWRDLVEKGINVQVGDFFSFSDIFYEITEINIMRNIYGLPEHRDGVKIVGTKVRDGQFRVIPQGPTDVSYSDDSAIQKTFEQQRGRVENSQGITGDVRDLVREGALEESITGPKQVSEKGAASDDSHHGSAFYDE
jgi:hypothetical protein